jgi:predicted transcriptional regulator
MKWRTSLPDGGRRLGPLEAHLLGMMCQRKDATVRELLEAGTIDAAYTTVMTTLDRLYKKGFLERSPDAQAYRYRLVQSEREYYKAVLGSDLNRLLDSAANPALPLSFLVDVLTEHDVALLDELSLAVNRKRLELRRRGRA